MHTRPVETIIPRRNSEPPLGANKENDGSGELFTVCSLCKRVLLPSQMRKSSAPTIRVSRDEEEQWINLEDISNSLNAPSTTVSHGLCSSCFDHMDASLLSAPSSPATSSPSPLHKTLSSSPSSKHNHLLSSSPTSSLHASTSSPANPPRSVLVVDDNKLQRQIHKRMVSHAGFECDVATSGTQAIEMVKKRRYSLVLMDLMMGDTDGWTTAEKIRSEANEVHQLPKIIAVTGLQVDTKLVHRCNMVGMDAVIQKPISQSSLIKLLSTVR